MTPCLKFSQGPTTESASELFLGTELSAAPTHISKTPWNFCLMPFKVAGTLNTSSVFPGNRKKIPRCLRKHLFWWKKIGKWRLWCSFFYFFERWSLLWGKREKWWRCSFREKKMNFRFFLPVFWENRSGNFFSYVDQALMMPAWQRKSTSSSFPEKKPKV